MISKQGLCFVTIFTLVLVLGIYYITMPNELLKNNESNSLAREVNGEVDDSKATIKESELLVTMRLNINDEREKEMKELKSNLTNEELTVEEKNIAFEKIKKLTNLTSKEEMLEKKIKNKYGIDNFININNNKVHVTAIGNNHNIELANNIMNSIQEDFDDKVSITIKFEK